MDKLINDYSSDEEGDDIIKDNGMDMYTFNQNYEEIVFDIDEIKNLIEDLKVISKVHKLM